MLINIIEHIYSFHQIVAPIRMISKVCAFIFFFLFMCACVYIFFFTISFLSFFRVYLIIRAVTLSLNVRLILFVLYINFPFHRQWLRFPICVYVKRKFLCRVFNFPISIYVCVCVESMAIETTTTWSYIYFIISVNM